jgi:hypothetical protein
MALKHIGLDQIDQAQLQRLIDGRASETRDIEYKRDAYGSADRDHAEFLADVSSFANSAGGDLVIGMTATVVALRSLFESLEAITLRIALSDRAQGSSAFTRDPQQESISPTSTSCERYSHTRLSLPTAFETFALTELRRSQATTHLSGCWTRTL